MSKYKYIKPSAVKALIKSMTGKRVSKNFLFILDGYIARKVIQAAEVHNGGAKTVSDDHANFVGM